MIRLSNFQNLINSKRALRQAFWTVRLLRTSVEGGSGSKKPPNASNASASPDDANASAKNHGHNVAIITLKVGGAKRV